jgi:uncharacterized membrane protein
MGVIVPIGLIVLALAIWVSNIISRLVYKQMQKTGRAEGAMAIRVIAFVLSLGLILTAVFFLLIYNIRIER